VSRAVVTRTGFQAITLQREPETIALTAPINANGLFQLEPEGALLRPFEGMGVDTVWQLNLPKAANPFDYRTIADVVLTIDYTALDDTNYREQVIRSLDRSFSGDRTFSIRNDFPDAWFDLNNPDTVDPSRRMKLTLPITRDDLPPHLIGLTVAQLTLFALRSDGFTGELTIPALIHSAGGSSTRADSAATVNGVLSTRRPGGAAWAVFQDGPVVGDWELQLVDSEEVLSWFTNGQIEDLALVVTLAGTTPLWT
jgi:hypothetical protein